MKRPDFTTALREADRELARAPMPQAVATRIDQQLRQRSDDAPKRAVRAWALAVAAVAIACFAVWWNRDSLGVMQPNRIGWLELARANPELLVRADAAQDRVVVDRGRCTLVDRKQGLTVETAGPLELRRERENTRIVRGHADFRVRPREGLAPVRLLVSHGSIEVIGTFFTIDQGDDSGTVRLHEGKIRFRSVEGTTVDLAPGQGVDWPLSAPTHQLTVAPASTVVPASTVAPASMDAHEPEIPAAATQTTSAPSHPDVVERLEHIQGLRSRGQWSRATEELAELLRGPLPSATRERLSFELGSIVTYQIRDAARACALWRVHQKAYPKGRYRGEVERAQGSLGCDDSKR